MLHATDMTMTEDEATNLARAVQATNNGYGVGHPENDLDAVAYAAVATATGDEAMAGRVCDHLRNAYIKKRMSAPTLPRSRAESVYVGGERLERPAVPRHHGDYVFVEDEQAWYMAIGNDRRGGHYWNKQEPANMDNTNYRRKSALERATRATTEGSWAWTA